MQTKLAPLTINEKINFKAIMKAQLWDGVKMMIHAKQNYYANIEKELADVIGDAPDEVGESSTIYVSDEIFLEIFA